MSECVFVADTLQGITVMQLSDTHTPDLFVGRKTFTGPCSFIIYCSPLLLELKYSCRCQPSDSPAVALRVVGVVWNYLNQLRESCWTSKWQQTTSLLPPWWTAHISDWLPVCLQVQQGSKGPRRLQHPFMTAACPLSAPSTPTPPSSLPAQIWNSLFFR